MNKEIGKLVALVALGEYVEVEIGGRKYQLVEFIAGEIPEYLSSYQGDDAGTHTDIEDRPPVSVVVVKRGKLLDFVLFDEIYRGGITEFLFSPSDFDLAFNGESPNDRSDGMTITGAHADAWNVSQNGEGLFISKPLYDTAGLVGSAEDKFGQIQWTDHDDRDPDDDDADDDDA